MNRQRDYREFLTGKHVYAKANGVDVPPERLNKHLMDWQRLAVHYLLKIGRGGMFEDCGLGKSIQQLAYCEALIRNGHAKRALLFTPPAVARQTLREAQKFEISVDCRIVRSQAECDSGINITNYERLHLFDPAEFEIVDCDEASIMKNYMGKTRQQLLQFCRNTPFSLVASATPAPNDHKELGNYSEFLRVMRSNEMLARWFINDSMHAGEYRLRGHAEEDFWRWMSTWCVSASRPSDFGNFSDAGFELPPLNLQEHILDGEFLGQQDRALSATQIHAHKRKTAPARADKIGELVDADRDDYWTIWCDTDYEADELTRVLPNAIEVRGSHSLEKKEEALDAFSLGQVRQIITKPEIAGFGLNWQHCRNTAFIGLSHSYEQYYQAISRLRRFGQLRNVMAHVVASGVEQSIFETIRRKGSKHEEMKTKMVLYMRDWQQESIGGVKRLKDAPRPILHEGDGWQLFHGDCVDVSRLLPDDSIDFTIHSPPFSNLYIYSDASADMGNSGSDAEFFAHYDYLIDELFRVTVPGRLCAVHCKDLPLYKGRDGAAGLSDFPGDIVKAFTARGWTFHSRVTIWKCPVTEMQRTKNHGLLHRQLCKDSAASRQGMADFLLVFRKWTNEGEEFPKPVTAGSEFSRFTDYIGTAPPGGSPPNTIDLCNLEKADPYSIAVWQRYASPVWFDIRQMRVLNYKLGRGEKDEKHICPLQLDVIERAVDLWTNPGDLVFDPFNGIGSTGFCSLELGRRYVGAELKDSYVAQSIKNLAEAVTKRDSLADGDPQLLLPILEAAEQAQQIAIAV